MNAGLARLAIPVVAVVVFAAMLAWFGFRRVSPDAAPPAAPAAEAGASTPAASVPAPAAGTSPGAANAPPVAAAPSPVEAAAKPAFDVVRVEPSGESVIAGRATPGATVDLMANGKALARQVADAAGMVAFVPPALPPGSHEVMLATTAPDGTQAQSPQSVTIVIAPDRKTRPLVALTRPGEPTLVLSQPDTVVADATRPAAVPAGGAPAGPLPPTASPSPAASPPLATAPTPEASVASNVPGAATRPTATASPAPAPAARSPSPANPAPAAPGVAPSGPVADTPTPRRIPLPAARPSVRIASVEAEGVGRLFVSGVAAPGASLRLYLNDTFVAPGGTGPDGRLAFTIERGIRPGAYNVRLDDVDPTTGSVRSRAEVPFNVPVPVTIADARAAPDPAPARAAIPSPVPGRPAAIAAAPGPATPATPADTPPSPAAAPVVPRPTAPTASVAPAPPTAPPTPPASPTEAASRTPAASPTAAASPTPAAPARETIAAPDTPRVALPGQVAALHSPPGTVVVPEVNTALVSRGDNLWRISKRTYGSGLRYTVIYDANTPQIRNPSLIYPGQIFVLPTGAARATR